MTSLFPGIPADILGADDLDTTANANNSADDTAENKVEYVTADQEQYTGSSSLMQEEEKDTGVVKLHVYKSYWIAVGRILAPMILVSLLLMQGIYIYIYHCVYFTLYTLLPGRSVQSHTISAYLGSLQPCCN